MRSVFRGVFSCIAAVVAVLLLAGCPSSPSPTEYTLSMAVSGQGAVMPPVGDHQYEAGTTVEVEATPEPGWRFDGWSGALAGAANPSQVTMDSDLSLTAQFVEEDAPATFGVLVSTEGEGAVELDPSPLGGLYEDGAEVTLTASAAEGWQFVGWSGALSGTENPATLTVDADLTVMAHFEEVAAEQVSLDVDVVGAGSVAADPDEATYAPNTEVTLTATPDAGAQFLGWSGDVESTDNPLVVTLTEDTSLTATFESDTVEGKSAEVGITGWVTDTEGNGIPFVEVRLEEGPTVHTNAEGLYRFGELDAANEVTLFFSAEYYTANSRTIDIVPGATTSANATLKLLAAPKTLDDAATGGEIEDDHGNKVVLPAGALVDGENKAVAGAVDVHITPLDINDAVELGAFPGDFRAIEAGKSDDPVQLETFALADFRFMQGEEALNLAPGAEAQIYLQLPDNTPLNVGDTIPLWYFDEEAGIWYEDGFGVVEADGNGGLRYTGDVSHFSWWNCDMPISETHNFTGQVEDENGDPVAGARVESDGVDYAGRSSTVSDENGWFCIEVKRNSTVEISVTLPGSSVVNDVIEVQAPDTASDCSVGGGSALPRPLQADFDSAIQGEVLDSDGNPVAGIDVYSSFGGRAVTDANGAFCLGAPADMEVTVFAAGRFPVKATTIPNTSCATGDAVFVRIEVSYPEDGAHVGFIMSTIGGGTVWDEETNEEIYAVGLQSGAYFFASSVPAMLAHWLDVPTDFCEVEVETVDLGGFDFDADFGFFTMIDALDPGRQGEVHFAGQSATMVRFYDMFLGLMDPIPPFTLGAYMQEPEILANVAFGDTVTYSWPGGLDIGAFAVDVTLPSALELTAPEYTVQASGKPRIEIDYDSSLDIEWDANQPGDLVQLEIAVTETDIFNSEMTTRTLTCILEDDGSHTVSSDLMAQLEPSGNGGGGLVMTNVTFTMSRITMDEATAPLNGGGEGYVTFFMVSDFEADVNENVFGF